jgi:hypothetical protein
MPAKRASRGKRAKGPRSSGPERRRQPVKHIEPQEQTMPEEQRMPGEHATTEEQEVSSEQFTPEEQTATAAQSMTKEQTMAEERTAKAERMTEQASRLTEQVAEQASRLTEQASRFPLFRPFAELNAAWWGGAKQLAAWYVDTSERMAHGFLEFQEQAMSWAKDTPWAPLFESQRTLVRRWIEGSADMARRFWQVEEEAQRKVAEEAKHA